MIRKTAWLWLSIPAASIAGYLCRPPPVREGAVVTAAGRNPGPAAKQPIGDVISRCRELVTLAESDPDGAGSMAQRESFLRLLAVWAAEDRKSAAEWAAALSPPLRDDALRCVLSVIADKFPDDLLTWLPLLRDEVEDGRIIRGRGAGSIAGAALRSLLDRDVRAALEWLRPRWHDLCQGSYDARNLLVSELGAAVTAGRLSFKDAFMALPAVEQGALQQMWRILPAPRLAEAAEWLRSAPGGETVKLLPAMVGEWAATDASAAIAFIGTIDDAGIRETAWHALTHRVRSVWDFLPEDRRAGMLAGHLAGRGSWNATGSLFPGEEYAPLAESLADSPEKTKAVVSMASIWGVADPLRALEWSASLTDAAVREPAISAAIESWAVEESWGASQWLLQQPAGPLRDTAAGSLARAIASEEPDSAWKWAREIANADLRRAACGEVFTKWMSIDPAAAREALAALPPSEQPGAELPSSQ